MRDIKLSKRLTAIASFVDGKALKSVYRLCDVGTDHAHIPICLLREGRIDSALAMDVIEGPLGKASENLALYGCEDRVELRLSDGLDAYRNGEADGLVIAGMGGRIMGRILLREPSKTLDFDELILQPQADFEVVRRAVRQLDLSIDREELVFEDGKYYPVMHVCHSRQIRPDWPGDTDESKRTDCEDLFGPVLLSQRDLVLHRFLKWRLDVNHKIIKSLENAQLPGSSEVLDKQRDVQYMLSLLQMALSLYAH